jgi:FMN-dependent oxidoreductase (nitrilotriacetate monooxygenase family)
MATVTNHVGLVATASTTYEEPFNLARKFASLDLISGGRAGWNLVTSSNELEAQNFGREKHMAHDDRYDRAIEFAEVVKGLWNTYEDDAFVYDKASGQFFDPGKMHLLRHKGKHFSVSGPLNVPRSPQGHTVIVQAGASELGRELAAETGEVIFAAHTTPEATKAFYQDLKGRMPKYGRDPDHLKILPGVSVFVGRTEEEARQRFEELQSLIDPKVGLSFLQMLLGGADLSGYPLDGPLPDLPPTNSNQSTQKRIIEAARRDNLTIRQVYAKMAAAKMGLMVLGSPSQIADRFQEMFEDGVCDGFILMFPYMPGYLEDFVALVVPELQRRGIFRTGYEGTTLRQNLGLPFPQHVSRQSRDAAE